MDRLNPGWRFTLEPERLKLDFQNRGYLLAKCSVCTARAGDIAIDDENDSTVSMFSDQALNRQKTRFRIPTFLAELPGVYDDSDSAIMSLCTYFGDH